MTQEDGKRNKVIDVARHVIGRNPGAYDDGFLSEIPDRILGLTLTDVHREAAVRELDVMRFAREKRSDERSARVAKFLFNVSATVARW